MTSSEVAFKVTYSSVAADMDAVHRGFDAAFEQVRARLGREYPLYIGGQEISSPLEFLIDVPPVDRSLVLGRFTSATSMHVHSAVRAARAAQKRWGALPWQERIAILRRTASIIRERKFELAAVMSLEVGKNRMEAMGDAEESADLVDYYCHQFEEANGYVRPLGRLSPNENTVSVLRPYGVFACIAPFNFPLALSAGMSSAALVAGNTVVYKPSQDAPWTGFLLYECYAQAGIPPGVFNYLSGRASIMGDALWKHPEIDGIVFTGSRDVGMRLARDFQTPWSKPALMELGGKNAAIVTASADLELAAEGVHRAAFGLQGQKCSACSRVYVDGRVAKKFTELLLEKTAAITIGDPSERGVYFGPVINERAVATFERAVDALKRGGEVLMGGVRLTPSSAVAPTGVLNRGNFVAPTVGRAPLGHPIFENELFVPILALGVVDGIEQALAETNKVAFGLTAGIFTADEKEMARFFDEVEAGVCYANRRSGATTGAWPGVQSFCGWKGSGSTGKGGCGPYYVQQFMREQSRTVME